MDPSTIQAYCLSPENEPACIQIIYSARWPNGFVCPCCGSKHAYAIRTRRLPLFECSSCGTQTSLTSGTVMEGSRTPIRLWILAMFFHSSSEGISAVHLASIIGTTYKTAWLLCHKIRHAMTQADKDDLLRGVVRINFAQYGRPHNPTIYRHPQEHPLLIGASMDDQGDFIHIKIKQAIEECPRPQFTCPLNKHPFIRKHVDPRVTDLIAITLKYSKDRNRTLLQICFLASYWMNSTFHGIGAKHLQSYLDQFCYVYNMAAKKQSAFTELIKWCSLTPTLTYPDLTRKPNIKPHIRAIYKAALQNAS